MVAFNIVLCYMLECARARARGRNESKETLTNLYSLLVDEIERLQNLMREERR